MIGISNGVLDYSDAFVRCGLHVHESGHKVTAKRVKEDRDETRQVGKNQLTFMNLRREAWKRLHRSRMRRRRSCFPLSGKQGDPFQYRNFVYELYAEFAATGSRRP
jgi:hypothetical protein